MKVTALISAADASVPVTSIPVDLGDLLNYSIHVKFSSATLNGSLKLQASGDNSDFADVTGSTQSVASGASVIYAVSNGAYQYVRVVWTPSAGTGTITATANLKEPVVKNH